MLLLRKHIVLSTFLAALAFVPKIIGVFVTIILLFPFMLNQMKTLTEGLFDKIVSGG